MTPGPTEPNLIAGAPEASSDVTRGTRLAFLPAIRAQSEDQYLTYASEWMAREVGADACDILFGTAGGALILRASTHFPELVGKVRFGRGVGLCGTAFSRGQMIYVPENLMNHRRFVPVKGMDESHFAAALAVPVPGDDGLLGVAYLRRQLPWPAGTHPRKWAREAAEHLAIAFRAFRAGYLAGSRASGLGVIKEVTKTMSDSAYLEEILQLLVNITANRFNYKVVTVRLLDETGQELILRATQATNKAYQRKRAIKLGESIAGRAIREGRSVVVDDVMTNPEYIGHDLAEEQGLRSMICVPLVVQGRVLGVMSCYTGEVRQFSEDEIAVLETLAKQSAVNIEHAKLQVRNTLMQEMHHRVKNNLQQVASLLRLQMRQAKHREIEDALNDSLMRVQSIASVHELLSRDDLDHVSLKHIAEMLGHHTQQSLVLPHKRIHFSVRGDDVWLNTNQATQIALVLNEMIQNGVEHGFAHADEGEIHINVEEKKGEIGIWVSNNGDPLPKDFDPLKGGNLGMQIVRSLVGSLGGSWVIEERLGWTVGQVIFPRDAAE